MQPLVYSLIDKAVYDYKLIEDGDKILVGASGGKDSTLLIEYMANRLRRPSADFSFAALNIQSDFAPDFPEGIKSLFGQWGVDFRKIDVDILNRLKPGRKMSCFWCSMQRRTELIRYAMANGFNKIALGHHKDDVLETLLMNMVGKAELATMPARLRYEKYPLEIIRPLYYINEEKIISHAKTSGYFGWTCTCGYQENSARKDMRRRLELLTDGDENAKDRLFLSLRNINAQYLP
ncbi:MAG: tRNA 2-thiocytidine biosynthesis protein TtcA [Treponema sp.]|nr:tRNA 2-thiocytidine biosynthesis protein TtcA [Treponema sp.]